MRRAAVRALRLAAGAAGATRPRLAAPLRLLASAAPDSESDFVFDSSEYPSLPPTTPPSSSSRDPLWDRAIRRRADEVLFNKKPALLPSPAEEEDDDEDEEIDVTDRLLLEAAVGHPLEEDEVDSEEVDGVVPETEQRSLSVGIVGAPNAGKSSLTNFMVSKKVAAVSRKTNTTIHEVLGVLTEGKTQICFFDTPGLMLGRHWCPAKTDVRTRVESAWSSIDLYDMLLVVFDVHRHITKRDERVVELIKRLGAEAHPIKKRVLCMNKVDLVEEKRNLLEVAKEFEDLPGYDRYFMISGLKGSGIKDLVHYLTDQAVQRPWDEEPTTMTEEMMKLISMEVVREKLLDHVHQEIPYAVDHRLMEWEDLRDGSLRVEQHIVTTKPSHRRIIVGKNGCKIGRIGIEANEELRSIFKRKVHLILQVKAAKKKGA